MGNGGGIKVGACLFNQDWQLGSRLAEEIFKRIVIKG